MRANDLARRGESIPVWRARCVRRGPGAAGAAGPGCGALGGRQLGSKESHEEPPRPSPRRPRPARGLDAQRGSGGCETATGVMVHGSRDAPKRGTWSTVE
eukprot:4527248-Prymnesium_polylepis.1